MVVADSALGRLGNLCRLDRDGVRFIVPLRADTGFCERFLAEVGHDALRPVRYVAQRQARLPARKRTRYRGAVRPFPVTDPKTNEPQELRVAYIHSSEEEASIRAARERALATAEEELARLARGLGGRYYDTLEKVCARAAVILRPAVAGLLVVEAGARDGRLTLNYRREKEAIAQAARADGVYALCTNLPGRLSAERVLRLYKDQQIVERRHRDLKQTLRVRPVFLHNDDRIQALVGVIGLALLVFGLIEADLRRRLGPGVRLPGLLPEGRSALPTARSILAAFQGLGLTYTPSGIALDRLTHTQRQILDLLEVDLPWPEQAAA
jgi:transposase